MRIHLYTEKYKNILGVMVEVTSLPAMYFQVTQGISPYFNTLKEEEYSAIIFENSELIESIAKSIHGIIIEHPKPLLEYFKTEVIKKLESLEFKKVAKMLEESKAKIETGKIKEGLDDLRGCIENFLYELIFKIGNKPKPLDKPEKNIELLEKSGYISGEAKGRIKSILYNGIYCFLSDKYHKREETDLFMARLCIGIVENIFDYLLERCIRYNIKDYGNS